MAHFPAVWAFLRAPFAAAARLDDRTLLERARDGDAEAFREVFDRHALAVHRFLYRLIGDAGLAEETTQETFVRAYLRIGSLRDSERLRPWLYGIGRNAHLERLRLRARRPEESLDEELDAPFAGESPETALIARESGAQLQGALEKLSEGRRAALLLRAEEGLPYEEIAVVLGWSLAKVKVEIHRGRLQLRELLAEEGSR